MVYNPSKKEEEYFVKIEYEKKRKLQQELHEKMKGEEKKRLKELHYMRCPKCGMELIEIDFKKIKVDRCSGCEGVWFDAGEFEAAVEMEKKESAVTRIIRIFKRTTEE